jgi:hypothetical protein
LFQSIPRLHVDIIAIEEIHRLFLLSFLIAFTQQSV